MTEAFTFADILFILLACLVTGGILTLVNRKSSGGVKNPSNAAEPSEKSAPEDNLQVSDEDK